MRPPWLGSILAWAMAGESQHFPGQHDRAKHENSTAIRWLGPGLGDLGGTIDRISQ